MLVNDGFVLSFEAFIVLGSSPQLLSSLCSYLIGPNIRFYQVMCEKYCISKTENILYIGTDNKVAKKLESI